MLRDAGKAIMRDKAVCIFGEGKKKKTPRLTLRRSRSNIWQGNPSYTGVKIETISRMFAKKMLEVRGKLGSVAAQ